MAETIKIAVCDDEKNIRSYLVSLIKKQGGECSIIEHASADTYLSDGKEHDLLFLDIEMVGSGAGLDGMGLARHIRGMEEQKFAEVFGRAYRQTLSGQIVSEAEQRKKKLVIQYGGEGKAIPFNDIYYMESRNHNIILYLKDGNKACGAGLNIHRKSKPRKSRQKTANQSISEGKFIMIKILFICHTDTPGSRELAALVGQNGAVWKVGYYGFTMSEETKKEPLTQSFLGIVAYL